MGLLYNVWLSVIHLFLSLCDLLILIVLLTCIYSRWPLPWLAPWAKAFEPCLKKVLRYWDCVSGLFVKNLSDAMRLNLLMMTLWVLRWLIVSVFVH